MAASGCTCESIRPGNTIFPCRSTIAVIGPFNCRTESLSPTAVMRSLVTAMAWCTENRASAVTILPWCNIRSASAANIALTNANTLKLPRTGRINFLIRFPLALCAYFARQHRRAIEIHHRHWRRAERSEEVEVLEVAGQIGFALPSTLSA